MAYNFPSFLCIETVCSFDLIVTFVKTKSFSELFFPCLGSILEILYAEICLCLKTFIVPLLSLVPHLKITNSIALWSVLSIVFFYILS